MADYDFLPASNGSGDAALAHITDIRTAPAATIKVDTVTNFPSKFIGTWGTLGSDGYITAASARNFKGHVSGADLIIDAMEAGSTDGGNTIGQVVIIKPTTGWANRVAAFIKNATNFGTPEAVTFGAVTAGAVGATSAAISGNETVGGTLVVSGVFTPSGGFAAGIIPTGAYADNSVTAPKLSTDALYLGHTLKTSNFSTSSTTVVAVTGLGVTVTIPAGGRKTKITVMCSAITAVSIATQSVSIWDGTVGSGTQIAQMNVNQSDGGNNTGMCLSIIVAPSAGSKTYNVGLLTNAACTFTGSSVAPAMILVEAV